MKTIHVVQSSMPLREEYMAEISDIWDTRWLTHSGPKHEKLSKLLCEYLEVPHISLFANGHLALEAALSRLPVGSEVITTPFTFASTTQAIIHCGLVPVFCDIEPTYMTMDASQIEELITDKTSAILPVHVYGYICNYKEIGRIAHLHKLMVIYDAAHAFGEYIDRVTVGNLGDISMFSFHSTKVFHTVEGGGLVYADGTLKKEYAAWRQFGMYDKEDAEQMGTNAKMTEMHAAMGLCNLRHIEEQISLRCQNAMRYREHLKDISGLYIPPQQDNVEYNYAYFPVLFEKEKFGKDRDMVISDLEKHNIFPRKYFYPLTSKFDICKQKFKIQETPIAEDISNRVLTLPLYADLTIEDVDRICAVLKEY